MLRNPKTFRNRGTGNSPRTRRDSRASLKSHAPWLALVILSLVWGPCSFAQSGSDLEGIKKEIESIKQMQIATQKDVQEIKKLLQAKAAAAEEPVNVILDTAGRTVKGDKNAKITIVEFSDYECPFCARHFKETMPLLEKEYIATGKAKLVFYDFPLEFHKQALKAAEAARCAGEQGKFWEMHDMLFSEPRSLAPADLQSKAKALGLNETAFQTCLGSEKVEADIRKDIEAGQKAGVKGTPSFVIGLTEPGNSTVKAAKVIRGAQPFPAFKEALDNLLEPNAR